MSSFDEPTKRRKKGLRAKRSLSRRGSATLEEVMVLAAVLPAVALCYFVGIRICRAIYSVIAIVVSWPAL